MQQQILLEHIRKIPGVVAAAAGTEPYFTGIMPIHVGLDAVSPELDKNRAENAIYQFASSEYFRTVGTPILEGREFDMNQDRGRRVVIVTESLAHALGRPRGLAGSTVWINGPISVVGVVGDTRANATNPIEERPCLYFPDDRGSNLVVRVDKDRRAETIEQIRSVVRGVTGRHEWLWILDSRQKVESYLAPHESRVALVGLQTGAALLLGVVGLYSLACEVLRRRLRSAAIRKAFGAPARFIVAHIAAPVVTSAIVGLLLGIAVGIAAGRWLASAALIAAPGAAIDAWAMALAIASVLLAALLALAGPARRALHLDPAILLRFE